MKVFMMYDEPAYSQMWEDNGHEIVEDVEDADIVQFTGGADVSPVLYEESRHPATHYDAMRDSHECNVFEYVRDIGVPMVGICRGAQFLNVMNGGAMWQDCDNHAIGGTHLAVDTETGKMIPVTSTHHQMMRPSEDGVVLMVASEATRLENVEDGKVVVHKAQRGEDIEAVWYPQTLSFCYQPHPEFLDKNAPCQQWYFRKIDQLIGR
jgi:gamma-glutamyl-gamma-aminobutyrate hydrolase PuuD